MKALIVEGEEPLIDSTVPGEVEDKYIFMSSGGERRNLLELTVELKSDPSKRILIVADAK